MGEEEYTKIEVLRIMISFQLKFSSIWECFVIGDIITNVVF